MKIAAGQISCVVGDIPANVRKLAEFAERAKAAGASWVVFPEMADTGYVMSAIRASATPWTEGAVPELRKLAKALSIGIICGVSERTDDCIFNSQVVVDATGEIVGKYRKTHLFAPEPVAEHKCFGAGSETSTVPVADLRFGLSICYDLRFPEVYRALALDGGANVLIISSAWPFPRLEHLRTLTVARAIENQCYVILANRVGRDNGATFCGSSAIIDPYGVLIAAGSADREELIVADVSAGAVQSVRERMPVFAHRRPEIYGTRRA